MKQNLYLFRYAVLGAVFLLAAALILSLTLCGTNSKIAPSDTELAGTDGKQLSSVSIIDLAQLNTLPSVNYTPDEFLIPNSQIQGTPIDLTAKQHFAHRGTFVYVIRNLDPFSPDFQEQLEQLKPYLQGDGYWHFTLYIPRIWSACNVYVEYSLTQRVEDIGEYDFVHYGDYTGKTEYHKSKTEPLFIDLAFYSKQHVITSDPLNAATVVTIHYEETSRKTTGIDGMPLIGSDASIRSKVALDRGLTTAFYVFAALVVALFIFICFLKRSLHFLPQLLIVFGIFGLLFSSYILSTPTFYPYLWKSVRAISLSFLLISAFTSLRQRIKHSALWTTLAILFSILGVSLPLLEVLPYDFSAWEQIYKLTVISLFSVATLLYSFVLAANKKQNLSILLNPMLAGLLGIAACIPEINVTPYLHPVFWLSGIILIYTAILSGLIFTRQEQKLKYLTENLQTEVTLQVKDMQALIDERDELLRYISHDMKKPTTSISRFLQVLRQHESDSEQIRTIDIIARKADELTRSFTDLSSYSKTNFTAECPGAIELNECFVRVYENFEPDCTANGIILQVEPCVFTVFGKPQNLYAVISNVILNAIEHDKCKHIRLSAVKKKNVCVISISDDGKGISPEKDIFRPYYSKTSSDENTGIGLYIAKKYMQSMNGDLTYTQENGILTFCITLPLA